MGFCSTGATEDGRAPTEELSWVRGMGLLFDGGGRDMRSRDTEEKRLIGNF